MFGAAPAHWKNLPCDHRLPCSVERAALAHRKPAELRSAIFFCIRQPRRAAAGGKKQHTLLLYDVALLVGAVMPWRLRWAVKRARAKRVTGERVE